MEVAIATCCNISIIVLMPCHNVLCYTTNIICPPLPTERFRLSSDSRLMTLIHSQSDCDSFCSGHMSTAVSFVCQYTNIHPSIHFLALIHKLGQGGRRLNKTGQTFSPSAMLSSSSGEILGSYKAR